ncbi:uncharacterized protein IL334_007188 [Kwoniella shivajii]|uniref:Uncharacterized protein n=1 Tax=Kwoniella shivajii TaxID=564305 RepID=A0ABZ1D7Z5_9TREE|nr:hypothetical protein IL334_007188 [Kwoniella shivajii]
MPSRRESDYESDGDEGDKRESHTYPPRQSMSKKNRESKLERDEQDSGIDSEIDLTDIDDPVNPVIKEKDQGEKGKRRRIMDYQTYEEKCRLVHSSYLKRESTWSKTNCHGIFNCFGKFIIYWKKFWSSKWWKWIIRNMPYSLSIIMIILGLIVSLSGPIINVFMVELDQVKYGSLGGCKVDEEGKTIDQGCTTQILYDGPPSVGLWSTKTLSIILPCYGIVAILQLSFQMYTFIFIRHRFIKHCCSDPESLSPKNVERELKQRRLRSLRYFERSMDISGSAYLVLTLIFTAWVSQTGNNNADGKSGWDMAIFLAISPFLWLFSRLSYRSRWAYFADSFKSQKQSDDMGWDDQKDGPPAYEDTRLVCSRYEDEGGQGGQVQGPGARSRR